MDLFKDWTDMDTGMLSASLYAIHEDIQSTKDFLAEGRKEQNPLLGPNPSDRDLRVAQAFSSALAAGAAGVLKGKYRKAFLGAVTGLEHQVAKENKDKETSSLWTDGGVRRRALTSAVIGAIIGAALDEIDPGKKDTAIGLFADEDEAGISFTKKF